jgi:hypothetical protein
MKQKRRFEERCLAGTVAVVAAAFVLGQAVHGQQPTDVTIDVSDCVGLEKPEERLACFEREVEAQRRPAPGPAPAPVASGTPPAPAAPAPAPPAPVRREVIPAPAPSAAAAEPRRERGRRAEPLPPEIAAKVTSLRETVPNTWTITLDNDQVWRQTTPQQFALRPGMDVRLYPTHWGDAYRLTVVGLKGYIQVARVR